MLVLTGSSIFYHEKQNGRYRFLSQRGIHPFKVWLARNSILFPVIAIACGLTAWVIYHQAPGIIGRHCLYAFAPLIAFVVVQFCILVTDQYIVGLVLAFLLAALAIGWCLLAAMLSLPFGIGFVPLMLGALIAGYKRLADLLNERSHAISKCVPWSILVGSMLVTVTATAIYRVYSIPATNGAELKLVSQIEKASEATDAQTEVFQRFESAAREITTWGNKLDGRFYFEGPQVVENPDAVEEGEWGDSDGDSVLDQYQANFAPSPIVKMSRRVA